jgi:acyl-CoA thioesterase YciA
MPRDTNQHGTIFGGYIMSQVDLAAAVEANKHSAHPMVTVKVSELEFKRPVLVGDLLCLYTETERIGTTSVTVNVRVEATRKGQEPVHVTQAQLVFVAIGPDGHSVPL